MVRARPFFKGSDGCVRSSAWIELVGELSMRSELFRRPWARHEVLVKSDGDKRIEHPIAAQVAGDRLPEPRTASAAQATD